MWLPAFKIIKGLFSAGEFFNADGSPYTGPLHKTSDGKYFSGSTPNKDQVQLTPPSSVLSEEDKTRNLHFHLEDAKVEVVYPEPQDYKKGFFTRYFIKDTRIGKIVETNKKGFNRYSQELYYQSSKVKWILEKPAKDIFMSGFLYKGAATRNRENILQASLSIPKLGDYVTDYEQFVNIESDVEGYKFLELPPEEQRRIIKNVRPNIQEALLKKPKPRFKKPKPLKMRTNLYTPGGRFKIKGSNQEYKGFYHIHPEKGAMEGAIHTDEFHRQLIPIFSGIDVDATQQTYSNTGTSAPSGTGGSQPSTGTSSGTGGGGGLYESNY